MGVSALEVDADANDYVPGLGRRRARRENGCDVRREYDDVHAQARNVHGRARGVRSDVAKFRRPLERRQRAVAASLEWSKNRNE